MAIENMGSAISETARALCGTRFRLHGRDIENGLDCIGLAEICLDQTGIQTAVPNGYSIRGGSYSEIAAFFAKAGFAAIKPYQNLCDGDVVLVKPHPSQWHFLIHTGDGFVHAHAGIGKVVFSPGNAPWPIVQIFRILET